MTMSESVHGKCGAPRFDRRRFLMAAAVMPWASALTGVPVTPKTHVFGQLPAPGTVERVFAAGAPAAVLAYVLGPEKLLGWPMQLSLEARNLLAPGTRDKPFIGHLTGRGSTMPMERLLALKPDVILDAGTVDATYLSTAEQVHARTGIPYVLIEGRLADTPYQLREAGRLIGVAERGEDLAGYAEKTLISCATAEVATQPSVYLARGADGLETAVRGSVNGEFIEAACGVNVAASFVGGGNLVRVSMEQIMAWAPDFIVTQHPEFYAYARQDPLWGGLQALKNKNLLLAPHLPFGWLDGPPGVNRLIGVAWFFSQMHRTSTRDYEIERVAEFHRLFYGFSPEASYLAHVLGLK